MTYLRGVEPVIGRAESVDPRETHAAQGSGARGEIASKRHQIERHLDRLSFACGPKK